MGVGANNDAAMVLDEALAGVNADSEQDLIDLPDHQAPDKRLLQEDQQMPSKAEELLRERRLLCLQAWRIK